MSHLKNLPMQILFSYFIKNLTSWSNLRRGCCKLRHLQANPDFLTLEAHDSNDSSNVVTLATKFAHYDKPFDAFWFCFFSCYCAKRAFKRSETVCSMLSILSKPLCYLSKNASAFIGKICACLNVTEPLCVEPISFYLFPFL